MTIFKKKPKKQDDAAVAAAPSTDQDSSESADEAQHKTIGQEFEELESNPSGLNTDEAKVSFFLQSGFFKPNIGHPIFHIVDSISLIQIFLAPPTQVRLEKWGPNALPKQKQNYVLKFLSYYWSPLAWAMEIAAIIAIALVDYVDFILIVVLLTLNASIGFYEEYSGGAAVSALQKTLEPSCRCYRDGVLEKDFPTVDLVPGDVIFLRLGDVVPADCYVVGEHVDAKIDQAALTGESLPATKREGDPIYSGSAVKQGEFKALVYGTGSHTFFGNAAKLIAEAGDHESHINVVLRSVAWFCISAITIGVIIELSIQFGARGKPCKSVQECQTIPNALVLIVGGIPIAMPTVLSVMQALGAVELSKEGAIVVRLTAVEELAGMEVLCSDKTGTLTLNHLTVGEPLIFDDSITREMVLWTAALASNKDNSDAIDIAMISSLDADSRARYDQCEYLFTHPFDPVDKWTYSKVRLAPVPTNELPPSADGASKYGRMRGNLRDLENPVVIHAGKGAPQVILARSNVNGPEIKVQVEQAIDDLAKRGYRSIGVSLSEEEGKLWKMIGLIPLFDPPRHDTKETIEKTLGLGVGVKMITGDQLAIAVETAHMLGMSGNIIPASALKVSPRRLEKMYGRDRPALVEWADGFAQVLPEDKFLIVESLQKDHGMIVGMTGDGVNDAPALKKADIGIAVADATDAARGAADIVLTQPGLGVIVSAILCSRIIFQRMKSYMFYSVSASFRIVITFTLLTCIWDFYFPLIAVVFFAILNDGTMITLARDRAVPSDKPEKWNLYSLFFTATIIGCYLTVSTVIFFYLVTRTPFFSHFALSSLTDTQLRGVIYLQVSISGLSVVFCTRSHKWFWSHRPSWILIIAFIVCQGIASVLGAYGLNNYSPDPISKGGIAFGGGGWGWVLATWIWCIIWFIPLDPIKRSALFLSKARLRRVKRKRGSCFPYVISFRSHQESVVDKQRQSFEDTRISVDSTSIDMATTPQELVEVRKQSLGTRSPPIGQSMEWERAERERERNSFSRLNASRPSLSGHAAVAVAASQLAQSAYVPGSLPMSRNTNLTRPKARSLDNIPMPPPRAPFIPHDDDDDVFEHDDDVSDYSSLDDTDSENGEELESMSEMEGDDTQTPAENSRDEDSAWSSGTYSLQM